MILRPRHLVDAPEPLRMGTLQRASSDQRATNYFARTIDQRRRERFQFDDGLLREPSVIGALQDVFGEICGVCGTPVSGREMVPHRWRPAQGAISASGTVSQEHYYWLAYEWSNLYTLCRECSEAQGQKFPVSGQRAEVGATGPSLLEELPDLLDPCSDDAEQSFVYLEDGTVMGRDKRARTTIDIFALNRARLVYQRREVKAEADDIARSIARALDQERFEDARGLLERGYSVDTPFAAVTRQFVNQRVQGRRLQAAEALRHFGLELQNLVGSLTRVTNRVLSEAKGAPAGKAPRKDARSEEGPPDSFRAEAVGLRTVNLARVRIDNFKGLSELALDVSPGVGSWTMLIGENGVGKTSILQAVALALAGRATAKDLGVSPRKFTRRGAEGGNVTVELDGTKGVLTLEFLRSGMMDFNSPFPVAVAAYGSSRLPHVSSANRTRFSTANLHNLFDPHASLLGTNRWVPELDADRKASVLDSVHAALGLGQTARLYFSRAGNLRIEEDGLALGLEELSSGYQAVGALALDLARVFIDDWQSLDAAEGLVLLDEIEAHLHPSWQMRIVSSLRTAFPRVQFLATTHSPLCLRGLRSGEVRVLRSSGRGELWIDSDLPPLEALTADQLLTSEHFGLHTTLDYETEQLYERYYALLATVDPSEDDRDKLVTLKAEMVRKRQYGTTRRERMMLEVIDEYLAREEMASDELSSLLQESRAKESIREIWRNVSAQG